jgi:disintegrin and metalloproteinase domain-containing protein 10
VKMPELHKKTKRPCRVLSEEKFYATEHEFSLPSRSSHNIYSRSHNARRVRREQDDRKTCTLYLQSDTMLWNRMTTAEIDELTGKKKGLGFFPDRAREEITSLFASHVNGIKKIYEDTIFKSADNSAAYSGISFVVRRVKINETERDCDQGTSNNLFCNPNVDVSNFLNINSLQKHDDFCLAYVFTYRDFIGGTLGLAWVGSPSRASGGICEKYKEYQEKNHRVWKSLNTGIVTLINYNSPVPPKVSTLTFAHEVGHNFGSPHDNGPQCTPFSATPSDPFGNFIMYASATSGDRPNNSKFSPCSQANISAVLDAVMGEKFGKNNCFVERESAFCGNNIVEEGEECDCGYKEDCKEDCCYGRGSSQQCKLKPNVQCSPSEGPCCNHNCTKVHAGAVECFSDSDCSEAVSCNGVNSGCPNPTPKSNMTTCNKDTQVCIKGDCQGSICQKIGWSQCFLIAPKEMKKVEVDKAKLCFVACQRDESADCISTGDAEALDEQQNIPLRNLLTEIGSTSIKLPPGAPCNEFRGYCDVFQKCRDVDADGPLARLKKLLFNQQTFNEIRDWIIRNWWAVLLMGVGLIVFMGIFIKLCAVHTPSSNPKKPPARKLTLRPQHHRQQGPPPPYSGPSRGGPPHGKGRGRAGTYEMQPQKV